MDKPETTLGAGWAITPTAKEKNAVQRSVTALLDALAPERVLKRGETLRAQIEQHRTPSGCVLQAAEAAVSVSWFADARTEATLGELHVNVWRGVVARGGGSPRRGEGATIVSEQVLRPIGNPADDCVWRASNGTEYDTAALAAHCIALLQSQIKAAKPVEKKK